MIATSLFSDVTDGSSVLPPSSWVQEVQKDGGLHKHWQLFSVPFFVFLWCDCAAK